MKKSSLIFFISVCILAGVLIFFLTSLLEKKSPVIKTAGSLVSNSPSPTLSPTPAPIIIDENTNLVETLKSSAPEDFSSDYKKLRDEVAGF